MVRSCRWDTGSTSANLWWCFVPFSGDPKRKLICSVCNRRCTSVSSLQEHRKVGKSRGLPYALGWCYTKTNWARDSGQGSDLRIAVSFRVSWWILQCQESCLADFPQSTHRPSCLQDFSVAVLSGNINQWFKTYIFVLSICIFMQVNTYCSLVWYKVNL